MTRASDDRAGEAGVSLIEAVIAVFILATAIIALIGGLGTSIVASDSLSKNVTADAFVRSWADKVEATDLLYVPCTAATNLGYPTYQPAALGVSVPSNFTATLVAVEPWNGQQPAGYSACNPQAPVENGAQRITLAARSADGRGGARLQIVKRRP